MQIFEDFLPFCCKNIPNIICTIWYVCFVCKEESSVIIYIQKYKSTKFEVWYVFCFGRKDKFAINTYHILIIHFGMYKEKNLTEFCLNFTYQILFVQFGMYICLQRGKFIDFLHTKMENLKFGM